MIKAQELCESHGGCPELSVPHGPYGLCEREATFEEVRRRLRVGELSIRMSVLK